MEEIKHKVKNVVNLDLNKSDHELFEAEYEGKEVIIKVVLNYTRGTDSDIIERPKCYIKSKIPREIKMYQYMMEIEELTSFIPKYYTSIIETEVNDFDKYWLLDSTEEEKQENLGAYAYIIMEKIHARDLTDIIADEVDLGNIKEQIINIVSIMCSHGIKHGDLMSSNILLDNSNKIYFIDFENSQVSNMPISLDDYDIDEIMGDLIFDMEF